MLKNCTIKQKQFQLSEFLKLVHKNYYKIKEEPIENPSKIIEYILLKLPLNQIFIDGNNEVFVGNNVLQSIIQYKNNSFALKTEFTPSINNLTYENLSPYQKNLLEDSIINVNEILGLEDPIIKQFIIKINKN